MGSVLEMYSFEDENHNPYGSFTTMNPVEAERYGRDNQLKVIANFFVWQDDEVVSDFTSTDEEGD